MWWAFHQRTGQRKGWWRVVCCRPCQGRVQRHLLPLLLPLPCAALMRNPHRQQQQSCEQLGWEPRTGQPSWGLPLGGLVQMVRARALLPLAQVLVAPQVLPVVLVGPGHDGV